MTKSEICACGARIDKARQALELDHCEACAAKIPGNILEKVAAPLKKADDIPDEKLAPGDKGNAHGVSHAADRRIGKCLKCGQDFQLNLDHVCSY